MAEIARPSAQPCYALPRLFCLPILQSVPQIPSVPSRVRARRVLTFQPPLFLTRSPVRRGFCAIGVSACQVIQAFRLSCSASAAATESLPLRDTIPLRGCVMAFYRNTSGRLFTDGFCRLFPRTVQSPRAGSFYSKLTRSLAHYSTDESAKLFEYTSGRWMFVKPFYQSHRSY